MTVFLQEPSTSLPSSEDWVIWPNLSIFNLLKIYMLIESHTEKSYERSLNQKANLHHA